MYFVGPAAHITLRSTATGAAKNSLITENSSIAVCIPVAIRNAEAIAALPSLSTLLVVVAASDGSAWPVVKSNIIRISCKEPDMCPAQGSSGQAVYNFIGTVCNGQPIGGIGGFGFGITPASTATPTSKTPLLPGNNPLTLVTSQTALSVTLSSPIALNTAGALVLKNLNRICF